ncbi:MAG TPA: DNA repair protein RecN [Longilinea sp.]|nr:DNA repair protein RecN [Longilinea sp.]
MLIELRIENFAIIQKLETNFKGGLTTFTGETGAGKSIILDAITALVGGRADPSDIRAESERASLEAIFTLPESSREVILHLLEREELDADENFLIISREIRREGRSTARINGRVASVALLREIGSYLVDIHGQSEHLSLLNPRQHLRLLDHFAESAPLLTAYQQVYRQLQNTRRELNNLRIVEEEALRRTDLLNFQVQEIESAHLLPDEEDTLRQERTRLANAENLATLVQQALSAMDESQDESLPASDLIGQATQALISLARIDTSQQRLADQAASIEDILSELNRDLRAYLEGIEFNPRRLEQVEDRLDLISRLKRKYGATVEAVIAFGQEAGRQLEQIAHASERITELQAEELLLRSTLSEKAQELSTCRRQAAETLSKAVEIELNDLSMPGARFAVGFSQTMDMDGLETATGGLVSFDETGADKVEFQIAPNPGEGLKPLVRIASGGETSRLMLALKNVLAKADEIPTLIFDEIDQGIGGRVGSIVGEKLWQLGQQHQVLCVTHLPQLAAFGDQHFRVQKRVNEGRTTTHVDRLEDAQRVDELAQMMGSLTDTNRSAAQEMINAVKEREQLLKNHGHG